MSVASTSYLSRIERALFSSHCYVSKADEDARRAAMEAFENSLPARPLPMERAPVRDVFELICEYAGRKSHMVMQAVSSRFHKAVGEYLSNRLKCHEGTDPKVVARYFASTIDADVIGEHLGDVDLAEILPVPKNFIDQAQAGFQLIYIPKFITIKVDEHSPLKLDNTTAVNGKKARLIVFANPAILIPTGKMQKMTVPVTVNNLTTLALRCQELLDDVDIQRAIVDQHGDVGVEPHWSYQKDELTTGVVGRIASWFHNVRKVSLIDRLFFDILVTLQSGATPASRYRGYIEDQYHEITSTTVKGDGGPLPVLIFWHENRLSIFDDDARRWVEGGYAEEIVPQSPGGAI